MSHLALQRLVVRLRFDPAFASRVFPATGAARAGGPPARQVLEAEGLAEDEVRWLTATDPRAFRVDPLVRPRTLAVLIEEFPASCALAARSAPRDDGGVRSLDAFFSTPAFHDAIRRGDSLALAFGAWIESRLRAAAPIARLETALAAVRRAVESGTAASSVARAEALSVTAPGPGIATDPAPIRLVLGRHAGLVSIPPGTPAVRQSIVASLRPDPTTAIAAGLTSLPSLDAAGEAEVDHLVVAGDGGAIVVEELPPSLAALLRFASLPRSFEALTEEAGRLGAEEDEAPEIVGGLLRDRLLTDAE